jgi:predicted Zn-dependent protease with MMP-like domain
LTAGEQGREPPDLERFQELVEEALEEFPPRFLQLIENVAIIVEDIASPQDAGLAGVRNPMFLLGLYVGVPFTKWGREWSGHLPDMIKIYRMPILTVSRNDAEVRERVRNVVLHELGHRAGLGEERLRELGVF